MSWKPDIFAYTDYRQYLADYYVAAKGNVRGFSYRFLARRAGFAAPNFIKLVIDRKRNLGSESVHRVADALKMSGEEHRFFVALVDFDQAEDAISKNSAFERVSASKRFRQARRIDTALFDYLSHWYYPAVRELAARPDFVDQPEWVAARILPRIKPKEARAALDTLLELGLLVRGEDGRLGRGEPTLDSGHEVGALGVGNYHRAMLERAAEAIALVPQSERDLSAITVCVAADRIPEIKRRLQDFREQLIGYCDEDANPERVYQINIQLFPLSIGLEDEQ